MNNSNSELTLRCDEKVKYYYLYNTMGSIVLKGEVANNIAKAEIAGLASGIYLMELADAKHNRIETKKIVK